MPEILTAARLRQVLDYNPGTGEFIWRVNRRGRGARKGAIAGTRTLRGGWQICIDRKLYVASRLAFVWMTGRWPKKLIDHQDCDPSNNRWTNLREATHSENGANSRDRPSLTPFKGVTFDADRCKYSARIKVNYRLINLGRFDTPKAAHAAYAAAAHQHFGRFARV